MKRKHGYTSLKDRGKTGVHGPAGYCTRTGSPSSIIRLCWSVPLLQAHAAERKKSPTWCCVLGSLWIGRMGQQVTTAKQTVPELITLRIFVEIKLDIYTKKEENYSRQGECFPDGYMFKWQQLHPKKRATSCISYCWQMTIVPTIKGFEMEPTTGCLTSILWALRCLVFILQFQQVLEEFDTLSIIHGDDFCFAFRL